MATLHPRTGGDGFIRDKNNGLCRTTGAVTASCAYHAQGGWLHAAVCHGVDVGRLGAGISAGGRAHPAVTAVATPRHCLCKPDAWHAVAGTGVRDLLRLTEYRDRVHPHHCRGTGAEPECRRL